MTSTLVNAPGPLETGAMARVPSYAAKQVGGQIDAHRLKRGMTQEQLAYKAGIDSANLRSYISGRAMPNVQTLVRISSVLEVKLGELLDELTPESFNKDPELRRRNS